MPNRLMSLPLKSSKDIVKQPRNNEVCQASQRLFYVPNSNIRSISLANFLTKEKFCIFSSHKTVDGSRWWQEIDQRVYPKA